MTNEEFQKVVLEKLAQNDEFQRQALEELKGLKQGQAALEQQAAAFQLFTAEQFEKTNKKINGVQNEMNGLRLEVTKTNLVIENEIRPAIKALAEGQAQQQVQLDRIEKQVNEHDEFIIKRVK